MRGHRLHFRPSRHSSDLLELLLSRRKVVVAPGDFGRVAAKCDPLQTVVMATVRLHLARGSVRSADPISYDPNRAASSEPPVTLPAL